MTSLRSPADGAEQGAPSVGRWIPVSAFVLSLIGFGLSLYLTIEHFRGGSPPCPATSTFNCEAVTQSSYSKLFGVLPVALLGLIFYTGLLVINWPALWRTRVREVAWARLGMAVGGIAFVLYLLARELFSIKAICLWCTGVHATTFVLFVLVVTTYPSLVRPGPEGEHRADEDAENRADETEADEEAELETP
jgi:uncharacterized membrane protein